MAARYREDCIVCICDPKGCSDDPEQVLQGMEAELQEMDFCSSGMRERRGTFSVYGVWEKTGWEKSLTQLVQGVEKHARLLGSVSCTGAQG